jgi:TonB family protein
LSQLTLAQQPKGPRQVITKVIPRYPDLARAMKLDGTVKVSVAVAPNGNVKSVQVVGGHPLLLKAAQDARHKMEVVVSI